MKNIITLLVLLLILCPNINAGFTNDFVSNYKDYQLICSNSPEELSKLVYNFRNDWYLYGNTTVTCVSIKGSNRLVYCQAIVKN